MKRSSRGGRCGEEVELRRSCFARPSVGGKIWYGEQLGQDKLEANVALRRPTGRQVEAFVGYGLRVKSADFKSQVFVTQGDDQTWTRAGSLPRIRGDESDDFRAC